MKRILGHIRRADQDYGMINDNDTIAVGVSGGKDSMLLLFALNKYKNFARKKYKIHAFHVDLGFEENQSDIISDYCFALGIPLNIIKTQIGTNVLYERNEKNPCALCSKMRKGKLFEQVKQHGYSVCAFAHHRDDCIESMLLSLLYEARMRTFKPVTTLDRAQIRLIRPFIYLPENEIEGAVIRHGIPAFKNPCIYEGLSKRNEIKKLLSQICKTRPDARNMIMSAIKNVAQYSLWD